MDCISEEFAGCNLGDERRRRRLMRMAEQMYEKLGESIPTACGDWAAAKAAYRLLDHEEISDGQILDGHYQATAQRFHLEVDPVLIVHDTTEFSFHRKGGNLGKTHHMPVRTKQNRDRLVAVRGMLMHSSLALTQRGLPIGIAAIKFWTRRRFRYTRQRKRHEGVTWIPIQKKESVRWLQSIQQANKLLGAPGRCIHIGDREADIFELFSECNSWGTSFVVRLANNRRLADSPSKLFERVREEPAVGRYRVDVHDSDGSKQRVLFEVRIASVTVLPPPGKHKRYKPASATFIEARECQVRRRKRKSKFLMWKLLTNVPVPDFTQAYQVIRWYAMRWSIETFYKILKSGCKVDESKLRTVGRLSKLISVNAVIAWKVFWLTTLNRTHPTLDARRVLRESECSALEAYQKQNEPDWKCGTVRHALVAVARLGGYLARNRDGPPGNTVMWRGVSRLHDIILGFELGAKLVGN